MSQLARTVRSQRQTWAAPGSSHDRIIGLLQIALPVGIGVLAAFLVVMPLFGGGDVSFVLDKNKVAIAKERMKIETARYQGADAKGQPFALTAASAVQKSSAEPVVRLNALQAAIRLTDGPATLKADAGRYDMSTEQVKIDGPIDFKGPNGYALGTRDATIDLKTRKLTGTGAVSGTTAMGTFSGDNLTADLDQRIVTLKGNARLRVVPGSANRRP